MDFAKMGQNLTQSLTGNVSKAILCIRKVDNINPRPQEEDEGVDDLTAGEKSTIDDVIKLNNELLKKAEQTLKGKGTASFDDLKSAAGENNYYALELQYNPASIRLDTSAGRQLKYQGGAGSVQMEEYTAPASTTLSCELLFDDTNNMDAFMLGDNPLTGLTPSNIANTVTSIKKGKYSVRRQMEGLLSLLTVPEARHVIFFWGAMCFRGEMTEVSTRYTMFNKKGYPVRGIVSIQIRQGDGNKDAVGVDKALGYDDSYWNSAFSKTFTTDGNGQSTFKKVTNNNLLNLKL